METFYSQSTLEMLPDEILLEVCKYLLCSDILQSFMGLNRRMTHMITQYRHHVSFYKASILTSDYLCINILPQIGSHVRSLVIDRNYSSLQDELFIEHFGKKMSMIFPKLERISLTYYEHDRFLTFLDALHDLIHLTEIRLYDFFNTPISHQPTTVRSLCQANNHRFTTILVDDRSSCLSFDGNDRYLNVLRLRINLTSVNDLSALFAAVPNVQYLDVVISEGSDYSELLDEMKVFPLLHLTDFLLKSLRYGWVLEELSILLVQLPIVQNLSFSLATYDSRLVEGNIVLSILPSTIQQFNYAIRYFYDSDLDGVDDIIASWPSSNPITWCLNNKSLFLHSLPWRFPHIEFSLSHSKMMSCLTNTVAVYNRNVEQVDIWVDKKFALTRSLSAISQCRRARLITIYVAGEDTTMKDEQQQFPVPRLPKLPRLVQIFLYQSIPSDLHLFSFILNAAPNLFRLDLPFDCLWKLLEDQQTHNLFGQRITSLNIYKNATETSMTTVNEEHIPIIASVFPRVRDFYVDVTHLASSTTMNSNENTLEHTAVENSSVESIQQKHEVVSTLSSESMLLFLFKQFKQHKLTGLYIDGHFLEEIKTNTEQWLRNNSVLCEQQFKAVYSSEWSRILIWM
ncbi:unnamed protein product [Rotaria sp. Silwood2]|nr:unnamed protein product [Rotaria sp. Silwood2]